VNQLSEQDLQLHVPIVGWLQIVSNAILVLLGLCGFVFFVGIGFIPFVDQGDPIALGILSFIGTIGLLFFGMLALPGMLAGYGLLKRRRWGQILGIIVGVLGLVNFPVGTAIGAYTLFVLFQDSANKYFAGEELG
jgi:hypothetical protein